MKQRLHPIELTLMIVAALALTSGAVALHTQSQLAEKVVRLHVLANSDSEEDQALKLEVRDKVLNFTTNVLQRSVDMEDAQMQLQDALDRIENIAQREIVNQGYDYPVTAQLTRTEFPLKEYDGFSLPAGEYMALRLVIGEGAGQNWWCVVYPPLCTAAATDMPETAIRAGLSGDDVSLITEEDAGYVLKFRSLELWEQLRQWLGKK
mgnify:CR=1 FL=1